MKSKPKSYEIRMEYIQGVFEVEALLLTRDIIFKNSSVNILSKIFVLMEIIDCIFLLFSKILSPVLPISPLY
jgi:hypothetical protein